MKRACLSSLAGVLPLLLSFVACAQTPAPSPGPAQTPAAAAPAASPSPAQERPELVTYQFGLLRKGPKWTPEQTDATKQLQAAHLANIGRLHEQGLLVAAGPVEAQEGTDLRGIFVFKTGSLEEARKAAETDPAIQAGRLRIELQPYVGTAGIGAHYAEAHAKAGGKDEMVAYQLVLMKPGRFFRPEEKEQNASLAMARQGWMSALVKDKTLVLSGPFLGEGPYRGLLAFKRGSATEVTGIVAGDPMVKTERMACEVHTWWVAQGVLE